MVQPVELPINTSASAIQMAQTIFGDGVTVVSASYTGDSRSSGIYTDGINTSPGFVPSDEGVILSTGRVTDVTNSGPSWSTNSNTSAGRTTNTYGPNNLPDFNAAAGTRTFDAALLDVDFVPTGDVISMQFVFGSEEYPEYTTSLYQDFVGVWINGVQVDINVGDGDVDPININANSNENLFINNTSDQYNTEMDGFTVTMTLTIPVIAGQTNSIRIGIADVNDASYDSTLLIAADSLQTSLTAMNDSVTMHPDVIRVLDALANDSNNAAGSLTITHINGFAVTAGGSVLLNTGQIITLNADGTLSIAGNGDEEQYNFTYTVENAAGETDVGIVNVNAVPCFVAGTLIDTPDGERPVHMLQPGDLVNTRDSGPQPIRWIGRRVVEARGDLAPIRIAGGALGDHRALMVSPQHRVLVQDVLAHLLFEEPEVLAAAKHLINDRSIRPIEGGEVEYVHLLFDEHQIIRANGLLSESFLPGAQTTSVMEQDTLAEITDIFPELDLHTGKGYGPAARRVLKSYEVKLVSERVA